MLARLFTPKWLAVLTLSLLFGWVCFELGAWQYGRHQAKVERNERLDTLYAAEPQPIDQVLGERPLTRAREWTHVLGRGTYLPKQSLVRNRPNAGTYGYEVLAALKLDSGESVIVDRGWVRNDPRGANVLPEVPELPTGTVEVAGWARLGEKATGKKLPGNQLASISVREAEDRWRQPMLDGYVVLEAEKGADGIESDRPQPLAPPNRDLGANQAYAFQWWLTMPLGLFLTWFGIRRELRAEDPQRYAKPVKPKKTRIWDEEDF